MLRRLILYPVLFGIAAGALFGSASGAGAHAGYDHSTPAAGETVSGSPPMIDVYFRQEIHRGDGLPTLVVVNDDGTTMGFGAVLDDTDRTHMSVDFPAGLADGTYTVIWHTVSDEDAEEAQGAFTFTVTGSFTATPEATLAPSETATAEPTTPAPTASQAPTATAAPSLTNEDDDSDVPVWALIMGIVGGVVVGGGAGVVFGRSGGG